MVTFNYFLIWHNSLS